jgi:hypothetical protein
VHLAQLNVARLLEPIDSPRLAPFVALLDEVNAAGDASPGFVWRLQSDGGNATDIRPWGDDVIVNLTVWESAESLRAYVFGPVHAAVLRRRREWFAVMSEAHVVLWWIPDGHRPGLDEAGERLERLRADGPTPYAFDLRTTFP